MLVVFANNETLVAAASSTTTVTTDPVAIGDNNRATGITNTHAIFNAGATGLSWRMQLSNDGQTWFDRGPAEPGITATGTVLQGAIAATCVYARLQIAFEASGGGTGAATFDIHVNFDRT